MPGQTFQMDIASPVGNTEVPAREITAEENMMFERDYPRIVAPWSLASKGMLTEHFAKHKDAFKAALSIAKEDIDGAGTFGGINAMTGFGFQPIRPDYLVPTAQGRTFNTTLAGLTANNWYGLYHNNTIGAAYNATPLYMRKEYCVAISGFLDVSGAPLCEEIQMERDGKPSPIWVCNYSFLGGDYAFFELPQVEMIKPRLQYRFQFKTNATGGTHNMLPIGLAFAKADIMRNTAPTQPSTTSP